MFTLIVVAIVLVTSLESCKAIECHECVYYGSYENPGEGLELCRNADYVRTCKGEICFTAYGIDRKKLL